MFLVRAATSLRVMTHAFTRFVPALLTLSACITPPSPVSVPEFNVPQTVPGLEVNVRPDLPLADAETVTDWWTSFDAPELNTFIELALTQAVDLRTAALDIDEADLVIQRIALTGTPSSSSTAGAEIGRIAGRGGQADIAGDIRLLSSWEYDAFGRIEAQIEGAIAERDTVVARYYDLQVSLAAEVTLAYLAIAEADTRLSVARANAKAQSESLRLIDTRLQNGRATQLDLDRAVSQLSSTEAQIPSLQRDRESAIYRLARLTSTPPTELESFISSLRNAQFQLPVLQAELPVPNPETLIRRRADIREIEAQISAALALSTERRADLFPRLTLNASLSGLVDGFDDFLDANTIGFGIGPALTWSGPDLRDERLAIESADIEVQRVAARYEQTVIEALTEVSEALAAYGLEQQRTLALLEASEAAARATRLAELRFQEGVDDFLDVLDAQRTALTAEDQLTVSRANSLREAVRLYRALGGVLSPLPATETEPLNGAF